MNAETMKQHIAILGWLHLACGLLFAVIGIFAFVFLTGIGVVAGDPEAIPVLGFIGFLGASFMITLGLPGLLAGWGLLKRKPWARVLTIVVGILFLFAFPVGTAIGVYAIWVLTNEAAVELFESPTRVRGEGPSIGDL